MLTTCSCCERVLNIKPEAPPQLCVYCHEPFVPAPTPPKRRLQKFILVHNRPYKPTDKSTSVDNEADAPYKRGEIFAMAFLAVIAGAILIFTALASITLVSELDWEQTEGTVTSSYYLGLNEQRYNFTVDGVNYSGVAPCPSKGGSSPGGGTTYPDCPVEGSIAKVMYDPANPDDNHLGSKLENLGGAMIGWLFTSILIVLPLLVIFDVIVFVEDLTREKGTNRHGES